MASGLSGFLNVNKPGGMSSHNVVAFVRRLLAQGVKVGHLGTLDPGACGVLPLAVGWATRTIQYLPPHRKSYRAEITLGTETDTLDAQGQVVRTTTVPELSEQYLAKLCQSFQGSRLQVPPQVCALHVGGVRAYQLLRKGQEVDLAPRPVHFYKVSLKRWNPEKKCFLLDVDCSSGTYIRSLARDIGEALGCAAHLSFLLRTSSGIFLLKESHTIEDLRDNGVEANLLSVGSVLEASLGRCCFLEGQSFQGGQEFAVTYDRNGIELELSNYPPDEPWVVYDRLDNRFVGVGRITRGVNSILVLRLERIAV